MPAVERFPLEVTRSRRDEWLRVTGRKGPWFIPDYAAAAREWDGIHLTVAGYLSTATRALPLDSDVHTLLGGWNPDTTWWLTDALTLPNPDPTDWVRTREDRDEILWQQVTVTR